MKRGLSKSLPKGQTSPGRVRRPARDALRIRDLEAREREASRALEQVASTVSHDIRNPLGTITMGTALLHAALARRGAAALDELAILERVERACKRIQRVIDDLNDVARIDAGTFHVAPRRESVNAVLQEAAAAAQALAGSVGVEVSVVSSDADITSTIDRGRVLQALANLVGYAVKVTPRGGAISLSAELVDALVRFSVSDTGPGLAPEHVPHVFDRYWQGPQGSRGSPGVGLFLVRAIAEAHRGRVEVQSEVGRGSTLSLLLPACPASDASSTSHDVPRGVETMPVREVK